MRENKVLNDILITDGPTVSPETLIHELFEIVSSAHVPLAVVSENGRLQGVIVRGALLGALSGEVAEKEEALNDTQNTTSIVD